MTWVEQRGRMTISVTFEPDSATDLAHVRALLDVFSREVPEARNLATATQDVGARVADDLMRRVGNQNRALLRVVAQFDGAFTLKDLADATREGIPKIRSRWANLGRSVAKTRAGFDQIRIFEEAVPPADGDGYFSLTMHPGVRDAIRQSNV
jgi:hypothetical protein